MNIQPNYMNRNYNQPAFQAKFAKDDETQKILKFFMNSEEGPESVYCLMKNLDSMNSQDEIAISTTGKIPSKMYTITNNRSGASVKMYQDLQLGYGIVFSDDKHGDLDAKEKSARGLYNCITQNLDELFEDTSLKPGARFIEPNAKTLKDVDGVSEYYKKQCELKKDIGIITYKMIGLQNDCFKKQKEKEALEREMRPLKAAYVAKQLDMRA